MTLIGVSGGSGSGKTTSSKLIREVLGDQSAILHQDRYYRDLSEQFDHDGGSVNFDHPQSIDFAWMAEDLQKLKQGFDVWVPRYDFKTHRRDEERDHFHPRAFVIVDGTLILSRPEIREHFNWSLFIDTCEENRFSRRVKRDVKERKRSPEGVKKQIERQVKPMHDEFVEPSKEYADCIIHNDGPVEELGEKIQQVIRERCWNEPLQRPPALKSPHWQ